MGVHVEDKPQSVIQSGGEVIASNLQRPDGQGRIVIVHPTSKFEGPKIIHLGRVSNPAFGRRSSKI